MVYRTHNLGELRLKNIGEVVTLSGWVDTKRNVSTSLTFIDLRDREGKTQIVFNNELLSEKILEETVRKVFRNRDCSVVVFFEVGYIYFSLC